MQNLFQILSQIISGLVFADFSSGCFHWFEDNYVNYCVNFPFLSQIAKDNELHHYFPRSIVSYSFLENISTTLPIVIFFLVIVGVFYPYGIIKKYIYFLGSFAFFASTSNVFHKYSHMRDCERPYIITMLQNKGMLCSHAHHKMHHISPDKRYCVILEYSNYFLDKICFWRMLENAIYFATTIKPTPKPGYDDYSAIHNYMHVDALLDCPKHPTPHDVALLKEKLHKYKNCK